ncbi:hypothetical protein LG943_02635 [Streptomonospora sp. S1-112]|uniref:Uncharacterized protein n=1 Tax=Streptomonospora mangrovi TaxID=2883123 RepID=A0A9X3SL10_9ACTN|nr:hypothetical protein [Streptomonospora mangrovi]MDA0563231.1 hypothetical protein [Streptomonospora mangrovi]
MALCRRPLRAERGGAILEYAGVVALVAGAAVGLIGVAGSTEPGRRVLAEVERAVCAVLRLADCGAGAGAAAADSAAADRDAAFRPQGCTTGSSAMTAATGVSVAVSPGGKVRIAERVSSDGTVEVSLARGFDAAADLPSPFRWGVGVGHLAEVDAGIAAGVRGGVTAVETWTLADRRAAADFRERVARSVHLAELTEDSGAFDAVGAQIIGLLEEHLGGGGAGAGTGGGGAGTGGGTGALPPPDRRAVVVDGGLRLTGDLGATLGGRGRRPGHPDRSDAGGAGGPAAPSADGADPRPGGQGVASGVDLLHLVSASAEGSGHVSREIDERRGTVAETVGFTFEEAGEVGRLVPRSVLTPENASDRLVSAALTTTRDRRTGRLTEVAIQVVNAEDEHGQTEGTARLKVTDANRATVRAWLEGGEPLLALSFLSTTGRPKDVTDPRVDQGAGTDAGGGGDSGVPVSDFDRLLHAEATYSTVRYAVDTDGREFTADAVLAGWAFGGSTGWESVSRTATGARYLGAPDGEGRRDLVPLTACTD